MQNRNFVYTEISTFVDVMAKLVNDDDRYKFLLRNINELNNLLNQYDHLDGRAEALFYILENITNYAKCEHILSLYRHFITNETLGQALNFVRDNNRAAFVEQQEKTWLDQMRQANDPKSSESNELQSSQESSSEHRSSEEGSEEEQVNVRPSKKVCISNASMFKPVNEVPPASVQQAESTKMTLRSGKAV